MKIQSEAVRLLFAVSALILVGMLSAPTGGNLGQAPKEIKPETLISAEPKVQPKSKDAIKITERRNVRKSILKKI